MNPIEEAQERIRQQVMEILQADPGVWTSDISRALGITRWKAAKIREELTVQGLVEDRRPPVGAAVHKRSRPPIVVPSAVPAPPVPQGGAQEDASVAAEDEAPQPIFPQHPTPEQVGYPQGEDPWQIIDRMEAEREELRQQMEWLTHHEHRDLQGCLLSLAISDLHYFDRGFMISSYDSVSEKILKHLDQFRPTRFQGVINGDTVPGVGIYRQQQMEAVLPRADQQIGAGGWELIRLDRKIAKQHPDMEREWMVIKGTHDYSHGDPTTMRLVAALRMFGVPASYVGTEFIVNCAEDGVYNVLFLHGYGSSTTAQTPPKMVLEVTQKALGYWMRGTPVHRVCHSHTHWRVSDFYRGDLPWDTTGGFQRFERSGQGANIRPSGCIAYVSPKGAQDILRPIEIVPSQVAVRRDMDDPNLEEKNRQRAGENLQKIYDEAVDKGIVKDLFDKEDKERGLPV